MPMKCVYSILRFVPEPVRGESVNVGLVVGSDEAAEWHLRTLSNMKRARAIDVNGRLRHVSSFVDDLGREIDHFNEAADEGLVAREPVSEHWLRQLWEESRNIVQLTRPTPIVAESVVAAADILAEQF